MVIDRDGTFELTAFPSSAIGPVPNSIDWDTASNFTGTWSYEPDGVVTLDFNRTESTNGYVGPAFLSSAFGQLHLKYLVSADQNTFIDFIKVS
jgi:hypothetical protein